MIKRHYRPNDAQYAYKNRNYEKLSKDVVATVQKHPDSALYSQFNRCRNMFAVEATVHPNSDLAWFYLNRAQQFATGHFQSILNDGNEFQLELDGEYIPIIGRHSNFRTDVNYWIKAFHCAMITRSVKAIGVLSQVSEETFRADEQGSTDFECALAALYKGIFDPNANLAKLLIDATATFDADELNDERFFFVSRILLPLTPIMRTIFSANAEQEFNQEMEKALHLHQEYWSKTAAVAEDGWISLPLTAMAVLAEHHKGYQVRVENEYIPDWVVNRK